VAASEVTEPEPAESEMSEPGPGRHPFRAFFARNRTLDMTYRVVIAVLGTIVVLVGIALIPLPGPGWLIVFAGLAILATEFEWADRLLQFARDKVLGWTNWVTSQSLLVRGAIGLGSLLAVAGAAWLYVATLGTPGWVPDWIPLV
jgi:uncharacterized protein (TIGR02611 family)